MDLKYFLNEPIMKLFQVLTICPPVLNPVKTGCIDGLSRRANMHLRHTMAHRLEKWPKKRKLTF